MEAPGIVVTKRQTQGACVVILRATPKVLTTPPQSASDADISDTAEMADHFDGYKMGLEKQLRSDGPEFFRKQCEIYPTYLTTNRTNLEYFYAEQVATIRKGPEKK